MWSIDTNATLYSLEKPCPCHVPLCRWVGGRVHPGSCFQPPLQGEKATKEKVGMRKCEWEHKRRRALTRAGHT